jgi:hypothetical protein
MRKFLPIILVFLFAFVVSCPGFVGLEDSKLLKDKKTYMVAQKEIAQALEKYNDYFAKADEATKAKWKEEVEPLFLEVHKALRLWKEMITSGEDPTTQEEQYLKAKSRLFNLLLSVFAKEEKLSCR